MTDQHLRELERRWKETGAIADEAAWLQERVRAGELPHDQLLLAATVGHEAARLCCPGVTDEPLLCDLCFRITDWGREAAIRMGVATTVYLLSQWEWPHPGSDPKHALTATEEWLASPTDAARENAKARAADLLDAIHAAEGDPDLGFLIHHTTHSRAAATATKIAFATGATAFGDDERRDVVRAVTDAEEVVEAEDDLRAAIRDELSAWALGYADPVRERVADRETGT